MVERTSIKESSPLPRLLAEAVGMKDKLNFHIVEIVEEQTGRHIQWPALRYTSTVTNRQSVLSFQCLDECVIDC